MATAWWCGAGDAGVAAGDDNLVARALRAVGRTAHVTIDKRIPAGAGLGGGSADAAAVLRWARRAPTSTWRSGWVPTCRSAWWAAEPASPASASVCEPLPFEARTFTLLTPPVHCSTPAVYRAWDDLGGPTADGPNDLEPAALLVAPELGRVARSPR